MIPFTSVCLVETQLVDPQVFIVGRVALVLFKEVEPHKAFR